MCGIAGFIDFNFRSSEIILEKMTDALRHRGPDGKGIALGQNKFAQVGLGHRRLSIIDLTDTGKQPMRFDDLIITYNGEIYNFNEIKKELEQRGHGFKGNSDTEVILHAFREWGVDCVHKFIGMFAFVIYDEKQNMVTCLRDRAGVKPFFYYFKDGLFLFASELKSFHKHPGFEKEMDVNAVGAFMQYSNIPSPYCIFKHCRKLKPAHFLTLTFEDRNIKETRYWNVYDAYNQPKLSIGFQEAKQKTKELLTSAFEYRMIADVPVGVFLSGGYDSTCIAAILQKERSEKLKTFTISIPDLGFDEAPAAKLIAKHIGTEHFELECSGKEVHEILENLAYYYDEPFADSSAIPTTLVSKMAAKEVTVALSGDGGDELFAGYNRYDYVVNFGSKLKKMPPFFRSVASSIMNGMSPEQIPYFNRTKNFSGRYVKIKKLLKNPSDENLAHTLIKNIQDEDLKKMFIGEVKILETAHKGRKINGNSYSSLAYQMAVDYETYMVDAVLQKVDRATMTASIEGREPYLDHRLMEWSAQLPDNFKYHNGIKKHLLKEIVYDFVPKELMDMPKKGFGVPVDKWLLGELRKDLEENLNEPEIKKQGIFSWDYILKLKTDFYQGKKENDVELWNFLMFQLWYKKWM